MTQTVTIHEYFNALIELVKNNYISRSQVDRVKLWEPFKDIREDDPNKVDRVNYATNYALNVLLNKHSFYHTPLTHHADGTPYIAPLPEGRMEDGNIAYIKLRETLVSENDPLYARTGFEITTSLLAQNPIGAVVDLRETGGGGCDPMLAAIGPLLDQDNYTGWGNENLIVGSGITWDHAKGLVMFKRVNSSESIKRPNSLPEFPSTIPNSTIPVAVLYGKNTCSASEAAALSLRGSPLSRSFGKETFGNTTGNCGVDKPFPEVFGAGKLVITAVCMTDRHHNAYNNIPIQPDVTCDDPMERAIEWIRAFPR